MRGILEIIEKAEQEHQQSIYGKVDRKIDLIPNDVEVDSVDLGYGKSINKAFLGHITEYLKQKGISPVITHLPKLSHLNPLVQYINLHQNFIDPFLVNNDNAYKGAIIPNEVDTYNSETGFITYVGSRIHADADLQAILNQGKKVFLRLNVDRGLQYLPIPEYLVLKEYEAVLAAYKNEMQDLRLVIANYQEAQNIESCLKQKNRLDQLNIRYATGYKVNLSGLSQNSAGNGLKSNTVIHLVRFIDGIDNPVALCSPQKGKHYGIHQTSFPLLSNGFHVLSLPDIVTCKSCLAKITKLLGN